MELEFLKQFKPNAPHTILPPSFFAGFLAQPGLIKKIKNQTRDLDIHKWSQLKNISFKIQNYIQRENLSVGMQSDLAAAFESIPRKKGYEFYARLIFISATGGEFSLLPRAEFLITKKTAGVVCKKALSECYTPAIILDREKKGFGHLSLPIAMIIYSRSVAVDTYVIETSDRAFEKNIARVTRYPSVGAATKHLFFKPNLLTGELACLDAAKMFPSAVVLATKQAVELEAIEAKPLLVTAHFSESDNAIFVVGLEKITDPILSAFWNEFVLTDSAPAPLFTGRSSGREIAVGNSRFILKSTDWKKVSRGDIVVAKKYSSEALVAIPLASGFVFSGSEIPREFLTAARAYGRPIIFGTQNVFKLLKNKEKITVSGASGLEGQVYRGSLPYEIKKMTVPKKHKTVLQNPAIDFLSGAQTAHPMHLCAPERVTLYTEKIIREVALEAAQVYPEPVTFAFGSGGRKHFAALPFGQKYEARLKLRTNATGAERYLVPSYEPVVAAECAALVFIKEKIKLKNISVQLPYCRSPFELEGLLTLFGKYGLTRDRGWHFVLPVGFLGNGLLTTAMAANVDQLLFDLDTLIPGIVGERSRPLNSETQKIIERTLQEIVRAARSVKTQIALSGSLLSRQPSLVFSTVKSGVRTVIVPSETRSIVCAAVIEAERTVGNTGYGVTNTRWLSLVTGFAVMGAFLVSLGAGCGLAERPTTTPELTPAQIRAEITTAIERNNQDREKNNPATAIVNGFAHFRVSYPKSFVAEYKTDAFILSDPITSSTIKFSKIKPVTTSADFFQEIKMPDESYLKILSTSSTPEIIAIINSIDFL